jgi:hypothetical protein
MNNIFVDILIPAISIIVMCFDMVADSLQIRKLMKEFINEKSNEKAEKDETKSTPNSEKNNNNNGENQR